ncbi:hypothetical protein VPH35_116973 [Triticum aestivum]
MRLHLPRPAEPPPPPRHSGDHLQQEPRGRLLFRAPSPGRQVPVRRCHEGRPRSTKPPSQGQAVGLSPLRLDHLIRPPILGSVRFCRSKPPPGLLLIAAPGGRQAAGTPPQHPCFAWIRMGPCLPCRCLLCRRRQAPARASGIVGSFSTRRPRAHAWPHPARPRH